MGFSLIADTVNVATAQCLGFGKSLLSRHCVASHTNNLSISVLFAVGALAPPTVKSNYSRTGARTFLRKKRRTRRSFSGGDSDDGEYDGYFGDGGDGPFGGGSGGGGRGWNFDGFGGLNWDGSSSPSSDHAFDFVYEVICWIALSNCMHFAFKRIIRIVAGGIGDAEREKVPMRLRSVC